MEQRSLTRLALAAAAVLLVAGATAAAMRRRPTAADTVRVPAVAFGRLYTRAPAGAHIRVEVLNASRVPGLARRATQQLRRDGFDVVASGNASPLRDSTLVIDRTGHPDWARRVARAMGRATVVTTLDSSRYVDVSVLIGGAWRPPPEPFHP